MSDDADPQRVKELMDMHPEWSWVQWDAEFERTGDIACWCIAMTKAVMTNAG